ncbi:hypothetical protein I7I48_00697 [Histoplasma ohiense]|nr:hypothetical protein I7I48_00697 [Histoplasma ohiense (nom. inval.)]
MAQVNETRRGTLHRPVETFLGKAILKGFFFFFFPPETHEHEKERMHLPGSWSFECDP